jgi:hypothetical protein
LRALTFVALATLAFASSGCMNAIEAAIDWTADYDSGHAHVWVFAPSRVAAGDIVPLNVEVRGGREAGIRSVTIYIGDQKSAARGHGAYWGGVISGRGGGTDDLDMDLKVPADAPAGPLPVSVVIEFVTADNSGPGTFTETPRAEDVDFTLEVTTPGTRTWSRVLWTLRGVAGFLVLCCLVVWGAFEVGRRRPDASIDRSVPARAAPMLAIIGVVAICLVGYVVAVQPLARGLMLGMHVVRYALLALWFVAVIACVVIGRRRGIAAHGIRRGPRRGFHARVRAVFGRPTSPYRSAVYGAPMDRRMAPAVTLDQLAAALERDGADVKRRRRSLRVTVNGYRATIAAENARHVVPELLALRATTRASAVDLARRLVPVTGPLVVELNGDPATRELLDGVTAGPDDQMRPMVIGMQG